LIRFLNLELNGTTDAQGADRRPNATLATEDPVVEGFTGGRLEEPNEITGRNAGDEGHARTWDLFVNKEPANAGRQETQRI
jgi:hypothetical protein